MMRRILLFVVIIVLLCCAHKLSAQQIYPESATPGELPSGISLQGGPGESNLEGWEFPYGTKLSVINDVYRNFEFISKHKTNQGYLVRQFNLVTNQWTPWREFILAHANGNVGIGTSHVPSHKLEVNGSIKSKEVNVTTSGWADYVFLDSYSLKSLEEIEGFYSINGHLENIPTEAEVLENGVNLSEMTVKLLEKVEELTIYLVEQNKRIKALEIELSEFKKTRDIGFN